VGQRAPEAKGHPVGADGPASVIADIAGDRKSNTHHGDTDKSKNNLPQMNADERQI
jgi:hypothetical protein